MEKALSALQGVYIGGTGKGKCKTRMKFQIDSAPEPKCGTTRSWKQHNYRSLRTIFSLELIEASRINPIVKRKAAIVEGRFMLHS
jgi:hypothetical protein